MFRWVIPIIHDPHVFLEKSREFFIKVTAYQNLFQILPLSPSQFFDHFSFYTFKLLQSIHAVHIQPLTPGVTNSHFLNEIS